MRNIVAAVVVLLLAGCGGRQPTEGSALPQKYSEYGKVVKVGKPYNISGKWYYPKFDDGYDETGHASGYGPGFHGKKTASGEVFNQNDITAAHPTLPLPSMARVTNLGNDRSIIVKINDRGPFKSDRIIDLSKATAEKLGIFGKGQAEVRVQFLRQESEQLWADLKLDSRRAKMLAQAEVKNPEPLRAANDEVTSRSSYLGVISEAEASTPPANKGGKKKIEPIKAAYDDPAADLPKTLPANGAASVSKQASYGPGVYIQAGSFKVRENAYATASVLSEIAEASVDPVQVSGAEYYRVKIGPFESSDHSRAALGKVVDLGYQDAKVITE